MHILKVHACGIDDLLAIASVQEHIETDHAEVVLRVAVFEREASTAGNGWIGVAKVNDVVGIDDAVVVDILVLGIAWINAFTIVDHRYSVAVEVGHDVASGITCVSVLDILIYTQVTEAIERTDGVACNRKGVVVVWTVANLDVFVVVVRHHFHLIYITRAIEVKRELPVFGLHKVEVEAKLPTLVRYLTRVGVGKLGITCGRRNAVLLGQTVADVVVVIVECERVAIEESKIDTHVPFALRLPFQLVKLHTVGINGLDVHIVSKARIGAHIGVTARRSRTRPTE